MNSNVRVFLSHIKFDGITPQEELARLLWDKFSRDIRILGKNISHLETCPGDLQHETIEWFFSKVWDEIQDLSFPEGRSWKSAVSLHFEKLRRRNSSADAASDSDHDGHCAGPILLRLLPTMLRTRWCCGWLATPTSPTTTSRESTPAPSKRRMAALTGAVSRRQSDPCCFGKVSAPRSTAPTAPGGCNRSNAGIRGLPSRGPQKTRG